MDTSQVKQAQEEDTVTWFKVDDGFYSHPKTLALSPEAVALWVRAGSYCGRHLTDGVVPRHVLALLQGNETQAAELVAAGLWLDHVEGYLFHDWVIYQPTRSKVETEREKSRERVAKHRAKDDDNSLNLKDKKHYPTRPRKRVTNGVSNGVSNGVTFAVEFAAFWDAYPLKKNKKQAQQKWEQAVTETDPSVIVAGAIAYRDDPNRVPAYTKHPATWLHNECWNDDPEPSRQPETAAQRKMLGTKQLLDWAASQDQREVGA